MRIILNSSGITLDLNYVTGIYRDRNPADKGKIIKHWVKQFIGGKQTKTLIEGITHPEYAVIKANAHAKQITNTYMQQGTVFVVVD